jgi:hypothetical protein
MPASSSRVRQRLRTSRKRIVRYWLSRLSGLRLQKSQRVYFVDLNGHRYKRIVLRDSQLARSIENSLERFGPTDRFPRLVTSYEHELWVEFVEGEPIRKVEEGVVRAIAGFYADVYSNDPTCVPLADTSFPHRLGRDLLFLNEVGVIDDTLKGQLDAAAERLAPERVWIGFDYTDAVLKNFVTLPGSKRICAVDVESLECDQMLGFGLGKALERWLEPHRKLFLDCLDASEAPDLSESLGYAELSFLAFWTRMGFLEQKWRFVDAARFERFLGA